MRDSLDTLRRQPRGVSGRSYNQDRLSQDLQRQTLIAILAALIGVGSGVLSLQIGGPKGEIVWLGVAVIGLVTLFLLIRYFELGIVAFLGICWIAVGTPAVAQGGSGGGSQQLKLSQVGLTVLLLVWGVRQLFRMRRGIDDRLFPAPVNVAIFVYLFLSIWSTANSLLFPNALVLAHGPKQFIQVNMLEVLIRILSLGGLLMVANTLRGRALKVACALIVLPGILTFTGILPFLPRSGYRYFPEILAMGVLAAVALTGENWIRPWVRILCGVFAMTVMLNYFVVHAEWVSGWLGALVCLGSITFTSRRKLFWIVCGLIACIVILDFPYFYDKVYASNFYGSGPTHDRLRVGHMGTFTNDRTRMWGAAFHYAEAFPLGIGLGNYRSYNMYFGRVDVWNTTTFTSAHGTYSQALSETGVLGLLSVLALIYSSGRMMRAYYRNLPPGWEKTFVLGAWGGCVGVFTASFNGDYIFPAYHNGGMTSFGSCVYTWLMIGLTMAIARARGLEWNSVLAAEEASKKQASPKQVRVGPVYNHGPYAITSAANSVANSMDAAPR